MTSQVIPALQQRIKRIQDEIRGVVSQYDVTQWELTFMRDLQERGIKFGSEKQHAVLAKIEIKVFGEAAE